MEINKSFPVLPEDEMLKYLDIFRNALSGKIGKNQMCLEFPLNAEENEGEQTFLLKLRESKLKDPKILESFYQKVIETYQTSDNFLILMCHGLYDIPGKNIEDHSLLQQTSSRTDR